MDLPGGFVLRLLHHLSRAGWSVTLRRLPEALSGNIWLMVVLLLPLLLHLDEIYPWARPGAAKTLGDKAVYLNSTAFIVRLALYFVVWGGLATLLRQWSIKQDASGDVPAFGRHGTTGGPRHDPVRLHGDLRQLRFGDEPQSAMVRPCWACTSSPTPCSRSSGAHAAHVEPATQRRLGGAVTVEHYHDLGKLLSPWFSLGLHRLQPVHADLVREPAARNAVLLPRQLGPWAAVSLLLLASHLLLPFVGLLSRTRAAALGRLHVLGRVAAGGHAAGRLLADHAQPLHECPGPAGNVVAGALKGVLASRHSVYTLAAAHADFMTQVRLPLEASSLAVVLGLVVGMGGLYLANTARLLRGAALIPVEDPRLQESLAFENP